jgi:hypothetical protein
MYSAMRGSNSAILFVIEIKSAIIVLSRIKIVK